MARSLNKVMLIGNIGGEPEIKTTSGGVKVAKVSLATSRKFNDRSGQSQEKTEWHRLTFWDKMAELVEQYVHKGDRLFVEGRLEYSQTEDDKGNTRYWTDIVVNDMVMLGGKSGDSDAGDAPRQQSRPNNGNGNRPQQRPAPARQAAPAGPPPMSEEEDDDLPF